MAEILRTRNEMEMIDAWKHWKIYEVNFFWLREATVVEYGPKKVTDSVFASTLPGGTRPHKGTEGETYIRFECQPSDQLKFTSSFSWDTSLPRYPYMSDPETYDYMIKSLTSLEIVICSAIVDALLCPSLPRRQCSVNLCEVKMQDLEDPYRNVGDATAGAMQKLKNEGQWALGVQDKYLHA